MTLDPTKILIGESAAMHELRSVIVRVAPSMLPVLVQGETGVGKELVAQAIHRASGRSGALVPVNVCAISDSMFEDALFGHVRGAFTGAVQSTAGYLTEAHVGTLFLDEISGLSLASQAKLLRALETRRFRPVGAAVDRQSDFRLVAASNEDLGVLAAEGRFRTDLLHRLGGIRLQVPPLRDRLGDVPLLVEAFASALGHPSTTVRIEPEAMAALQQHWWPGNVRELRHVVEAALVMNALGCVKVGDVLALTRATPPVRRARRQRQHEVLLDILKQVEWDIDRAARRLGVHRATVYRRLKQLGVDSRHLAPEVVRGDEAHVVL